MIKKIVYALLYFVAAHFIYLFISSFFMKENTLESVNIIIMIKILVFMVAIVLLVKYLKLNIKSTVLHFTDHENLKHNLYWIFFGLLIAIISQLIIMHIENYVFNINNDPNTKAQTIELIKMNRLAIISPIILSPLFEELVFRKVIFSTLYKRYSFIAAGTLSSMMFSILHADLTHLFTYFLIGLILAYSYVKTSNILVPISIHALLNTIPIILLFI